MKKILLRSSKGGESFNQKVQQSNNVNELKKLISPNFYDITNFIVFLRIEELLDNTDSDIMLTLAKWLYFFGEDEQAFAYLNEAKNIQPNCEKVLCMEIWLNGNSSAEVVIELCNSLLKLYPENEWITKLKKDIKRLGYVKEIDFPNIFLKWEYPARPI